MRLIERGAILVLRPDSDELPEGLRRETIRRLASVRIVGDGRGFAWCRVRDDGRVLVVVAGEGVTPATLRHEILLAAQLVAGEAATAEALAEVLEDGRRLHAAAKAASSQDPGADDVLRDIARIAGVWDRASRPSSPPAYAEASAMTFADVSAATIRLALGLGMPDASAAAAALHALATDLLGLLPEPSSASARQLVAARFRGGDTPVSDRLFAAAAEALDAAAPGPGR